MRDQTALREPTPTRAWLVADLTRRIAQGELPSGTRLPSERSLAASYGLSRSVVREALRTLIDQRLIEVRAGRGAYVQAPRSIDTAETLDHVVRRQQPTPRELIEARRAIESETTRLAALRAEAPDIERIAARLEQCAKSTSLTDQVRYDLAFHLSIVRSAKSPVLETLFASIAGLTVELMLRSLSDSSLLKNSLPIHDEIFRAISAGDPDAASQHMLRHLAVAEATYGRDFNRPLDALADRALRTLADPNITLRELLTLPDALSEE